MEEEALAAEAAAPQKTPAAEENPYANAGAAPPGASNMYVNLNRSRSSATALAPPQPPVGAPPPPPSSAPPPPPPEGQAASPAQPSPAKRASMQEVIYSPLSQPHAPAADAAHGGAGDAQASAPIYSVVDKGAKSSSSAAGASGTPPSTPGHGPLPAVPTSTRAAPIYSTIELDHGAPQSSAGSDASAMYAVIDKGSSRDGAAGRGAAGASTHHYAQPQYASIDDRECSTQPHPKVRQKMTLLTCTPS